MEARLLELVATEPRILPYFDMPMQHGSDEVLKRMRRPERNRTIREKMARIRDVVPDVAIRTTCIVGFPGETDADFETLLALLEEVQIDRVGAFTYSAQEGTAAHALRDDVPESVKLERLERLNELQRLITAERFEQRVGRTVRAIVDRAHDDGTAEARTIWQAHEIDGVTIVGSGKREAGSGELRSGDILEVRIDGVDDDCDLRARLLSRASRLPFPASRFPLPVVSIGAYGR